jgi:CRP-like cAMP-binding protein
MANQFAAGKRLLQCLSHRDLDILRPHWEPVDLRVRLNLERPDKHIERVCFPNTGIISVVAEVKGDQGIEVGVIGFEGMTGLPLLMGDDRWANNTYVQSSGEGVTIAADIFSKILQNRPSIHAVLLKYAKTFVMQIAHTALSNGRANIAKRLSRWLLMAQDRLRTDEMALTHDFLAIMLGVRRSGVTEQLQSFASAGLLQSERGCIRILQRDRLLEFTGDFYGAPERDYERLLRPYEAEIVKALTFESPLPIF